MIKKEKLRLIINKNEDGSILRWASEDFCYNRSINRDCDFTAFRSNLSACFEGQQRKIRNHYIITTFADVCSLLLFSFCLLKELKDWYLEQCFLLAIDSIVWGHSLGNCLRVLWMLEQKSILRQLATCTEENKRTKNLFLNRSDPHHSLKFFQPNRRLISR